MGGDEAKKRLVDLLIVAAKSGVTELYLFAVDDRLFVTFVEEGAAPRVSVLESGGAILEAMREIMEADGETGGLDAGEKEWCLDLGKAHFEMSTGPMVLVRILCPAGYRDPPRRPAPRPLTDEVPVFDDDAFAAALAAEPVEASPPSPRPPTDEVPALDEEALAAALEPEQADAVVAPAAEPLPFDDGPIVTAVEQPSPAPAAAKGPEERARETMSAILLGNKPFPAQAVRAIPVHLTTQGRFVPLMFEGTKIWVAVCGPTTVREMVSSEVGTIEVSLHQLQDLMTCYRVDPRHRKK